MKSLWLNNQQRPPGWNTHLIELGAARITDDLYLQQLVPSTSVEWRDITFSVNEWGMRDKHYDKAKRPETTRIVLLGSSKEMGWGIGDNSTFESIIEERLSEEMPGDSDLEILNFSVHGYTEIQSIAKLETGILSEFDADAVVFCTHTIWMDKLAENLHRLKRDSIHIDYPFLNEIAEEAGLGKTPRYRRDPENFKPYALDIADWAMRRLSEAADSLGIPAYVAFIPSINLSRENREPIIEATSRYGIEFVDVSDAYGDEEEIDLRVSPWDSHPNERAHVLIADALLPEIRRMLAGGESSGSEMD